MSRYSRFPAVNRDAESDSTLDTQLADLPAYADVDIDSMTVDEVVEWVGDNDDRRDFAIATEQKGRGRKGIVEGLAPA